MSEREIEELEEQIHQLRIKLQGIAKGRQLTDPEVMGASQMLDAMLNEYQKLIKDKK